ncbi:MAG: cobalt transporter CbiM, partial [Alphaproteobacteria bacterium]
MHIVDGALAGEVVAGGAVLAAGGLAIGLKSLDLERIPAAGLLSATFFTASLIHVPLGPSSVHLIMNGLAGLVLGWAAFPALFVGLLLQAVFFGFGGVTVLGVNTVAIALPAVLAGLATRSLVRTAAPAWSAAAGA